jgi:hypothetical protein
MVARTIAGMASYARLCEKCKLFVIASEIEWAEEDVFRLISGSN